MFSETVYLQQIARFLEMERFREFWTFFWGRGMERASRYAIRLKIKKLFQCWGRVKLSAQHSPRLWYYPNRGGYLPSTTLRSSNTSTQWLVGLVGNL